jgi:hypothetical protein
VAFCRDGPGVLLAKCFDGAVLDRPRRFPNQIPRGKTLVIAADFGGAHAGQLFDTYSFLVLDIERNGGWVEGQRLFRQHVMSSGRRMAFKSLNDKLRRNALAPFLSLGNSIDGWLVSFAISKKGRSAFQRTRQDAALIAELGCWKPGVQERLMRILHLGAFLLSGLSCEGQNVRFVTDHDEIAANTEQLTRLTKLFALISSNFLAHQLGHLRCATAQSDDGTLWLEDLLAICDLAAGTVCEVATAMGGRHPALQRTVVSALPTGLSRKSRRMAAWLSSRTTPLQQITCIVDLSATSPRMRATMLQWHAFPGLIQTLT